MFCTKIYLQKVCVTVYWFEYEQQPIFVKVFFLCKGWSCVRPYNGSFSRNINLADMMTLQGQGRFLPAAADIPVNSFTEIENLG